VDEALDIIDNGALAFLGVDTGRGPHVTPQLYARAAGRLWATAAKSALKVRTIRARPSVVLTVFSIDGRRAVVVHGDAHIVDYADPFEVLRSPIDGLLGAHGARRLLTDNPAEIANSLADVVRGRITIDDRRVLIDVHPDRVEVFDAPGAAVFAARTASGLLARPAAWDEHETTAHLAHALPAPLEDSLPTCVTIDHSDGAGAGNKRGEMFRGLGRATGDAVLMDVERITRWSGDDVRTECVA
jgi:hypothetical protein